MAREERKEISSMGMNRIQTNTDHLLPETVDGLKEIGQTYCILTKLRHFVKETVDLGDSELCHDADLAFIGTRGLSAGRRAVMEL
jgi:hypothetical protein